MTVHASALKQGWSYDTDTRLLTVGSVDCVACLWNREEIGRGRFQMYPWAECSKCKGTGRRGRGDCRACDSFRTGYRPHMIGEYRPGLVIDLNKPTDGGPCPKCQGTMITGAREGGWGNAPLPADLAQVIVADTPVLVTASTEGMTWGEQHMGFGQADSDELSMTCMMSLVDYGRRWAEIGKLPVGERWPRVEQVRDEYRTKIAESMRRVVEVGVRTDVEGQFAVMSQVAIILRPQGLTIYRVWRKDQPALTA